jgi:outer membrane immunogenic protein
MLRDKLKIALLGALVALGVGWCRDAMADGLPKGGLLPIGEVAKAGSVWNGAYVGVGGGYQVGDTGLSVGDSTYELLSIDGLSSRGWVGDVRVGFDWQVAGSPFVVGLLAGYSMGEAEFSARAMDGFLGLNASLEPTWYVGGRVGFAFGKSLAYAGYAWGEAEANGSISMGTSVASGSTTINGHMLLAGLETQLAPQLTLAAEYKLSMYDDIKIGDYVTVDPEVHAFMLRLNWRPLAK